MAHSGVNNAHTLSAVRSVCVCIIRIHIDIRSSSAAGVTAVAVAKAAVAAAACAVLHLLISQRRVAAAAAARRAVRTDPLNASRFSHSLCEYQQSRLQVTELPLAGAFFHSTNFVFFLFLCIYFVGAPRDSNR